MNVFKLLNVTFAILILTSCASVRVSADYDEDAKFDEAKTFAFYKSGIDKVQISDLDKKRILRSIESEMLKKGYSKSDDPDLLVNIFTKAEKHVDIYNNNWGYGWGPWYGGPASVSTTTNGVLYIDLIDSKSKQLIWQGRGEGYLTHNRSRKIERIQEFVSKILEQYPPQNNAN